MSDGRANAPVLDAYDLGNGSCALVRPLSFVARPRYSRHPRPRGGPLHLAISAGGSVRLSRPQPPILRRDTG